MDILNVMGGLGDRLRVITSLRMVYDYPPDNASDTPFGVVNWPDPLSYDATMGRGVDQATFEVHVCVNKNDAKTAAGALSLYLAGSGSDSVKSALEGDQTLGGYADSLRVTEARVEIREIAATQYLTGTFTVDVFA